MLTTEKGNLTRKAFWRKWNKESCFWVLEGEGSRDSFNFTFFHNSWEMVKEDLLEVFKEFFNSGIVNKKTIAINLVTSLYKMMIKVLSLTWFYYFSRASSFGERKTNFECFLVANEVLKEYRKANKEALVFKIDFQKVYDYVD